MHDYYIVNNRFRFGKIPEFDVWLAQLLYLRPATSINFFKKLAGRSASTTIACLMMAYVLRFIELT